MDNPDTEKNMNETAPMPMRLLGRTGLKVSAMGLGGMGVMDEKHEDLDSRIEIINTALDHGINFIDTARGYFDSEEIIGHVLKERRNDAYIATKTYLRSAKGSEKELLESLEKLQVKKIDLYQIHHIQYMKEFEKIMEPGGAMEVVKSYQKQGVIDFIGVSSHNPHILSEILESDLFDTVQFPFSVVEREHFENIRDVVKRRNIGTIIMKPLAGGNVKSVDSALRYLLSHDVSTVIPGCSTVEQVMLNVGIAKSFTGITEEEKRKIIEEVKNLPDQFCRRCRYCEKTCPQGIQIADIFRCEDYLILNATYAREEYKKLKKKVKDCIGCGKCEEICPYNLPVREKLYYANRRLTRGKLEDFIVKIVRKAGLYDIARKIYFALGFGIPKR